MKKNINNIILLSLIFISCEKIFDPIQIKKSPLIAFTTFDNENYTNGICIGGPYTIPHKISDTGNNPFISYNGEKVAYDLNNGGSTDIYIIDIKNKQTNFITILAKSGQQNFADINWSHDSKKIAYSSMKDGKFDIYVYDLERNIEQKISDLTYSIIPVWSYDDSQIVFYSLLGNEFKITVVNSDGTNLKILEISGKVGTPNWLLDGRLVCNVKTTSIADSVFNDIIAINSDGTGLEYLSEDHISLFSSVYDNDHIIIFNENVNPLRFEILNIKNKTRKDFFELEKNDILSQGLSPDNKWVAYFKPSERPKVALFVRDIENNNEILLSNTARYCRITWSQ